MMVNNGRGLLAIVMGGGKTVVSIATLERLIENGEVKRAVIVVPASLKYQWQEQIREFSGRHALVIDGLPKRREFLYSIAHNYRYVITNYEAVMNDWVTMRKMIPTWQCIVIDEATQIKGLTASRSKKVKFMGARIEHRYALTGQPVENRPEDLFSIMEFVDPNVLGPFDKFDRVFIVRDDNGKMKRARNLPRLKASLKTIMFRRTRDDIKHLLPDIIPSHIPVPLGSKPIGDLYQTICADLLSKLYEVTTKFGGTFDLAAHYGKSDSQSTQAHGDIMSRMLALRLLCDDPQLLIESAENFADDATKEGSEYAHGLLQRGLLDPVRGVVGPKRKVLRDLINAILDEDPDNKIVLFSTFKTMLRLIEADLGYEGCVQYTGDMNARQKDAAKHTFKTDPDVRVLLSSDAGGYGVDIPEANYLISADLPWSAGKYDQRQSRIIRISSEWKNVQIMTATVMGSIEDFMQGVLDQKGGVASAFVDGQYDEKGGFIMTLESLTEFLSTNAP